MSAEFAMACAVLLTVISLSVQGPIPVYQATLSNKTIQQAAISTMLTGVLGAAAFGLLTAPFVVVSDQSLTREVAEQMAKAGLLYTVANLLMFHALSLVGATHFGVIFTGRILPIAILSHLYLGEKFGFGKVTGITIVVLGVLWAIKRKPRQEKQEGKKTLRKQLQRIQGDLEAILGTLAFGTANFYDMSVVRHYDPAVYLPIRLLLPVIFLLLITSLMLAVGLWKPKELKTNYRRITAPYSIEEVLREAEFQQAIETRSTLRRWMRLQKIMHQRLINLATLAVLVALSASTFMVATRVVDSHGAVLAAIHQLSLFATIWYGDRKNSERTMRQNAAPATVCIVGVATTLLIG